MSNKNRNRYTKPTGAGAPPIQHGAPQRSSLIIQELRDDMIYRTITTCAGIGDSIWLMQKLVNSGERFHFILPDGEPQRGKALFDLLPQVAVSCEYAPDLGYKKIKAENVGKGLWAEIKPDSFTLTANEHLELGRRIENFLPDLQTSFTLDYATDEDDKSVARVMLPAGHNYIGIYTSAYSNARHWNGWQAADWMKLIKFLAKSKETVFVVIGADYDIGIPGELMEGMKELNIPFVDTVGQPLSVVVEILKRLVYFIGFPSGLSILNETLGKDGTMMYPKHLAPMMNAWAHPDRIIKHNYKGCVFPTPEGLYDWLRMTYKIFDKL